MLLAANLVVAALTILLAPTARAQDFASMMEGFVTHVPEGGVIASSTSLPDPSAAAASQRRAGDGSHGWHSAAWRAIRDNTTAQLRDVPDSFASYKANRRRRYRNKQHEAQAQAAFKSNLQYIVAENAKGSNPFVLGVTNFTDLSYEEFAAQYLSAPQAVPPPPSTKQNRKNRHLLATTALATPDSCFIHWGFAAYNPLNRSVISSVKNQGGCGACWAFGAAASLESWVAMQNYTLDGANMLDLSEQMLVDCAYGQDGCGGGWPTAAWDYILANKGIAPEAVRPYTSGYTGTWEGGCPAAMPRSLGSGILKGYNWVMPQTDSAVAAAVQTQPVFISVAAGAEFQNYAGGAIVCNGTAVTHAVQNVGCGYILQNNVYVPVYMIKNQWSPYWGYGGFAYVMRTTEGYGNCLVGFGAYTLS